MANIIKVRALENFKDMVPEEMPLNIWLPHVEINSERFISHDSGEVWHRFSDVNILSEDEEYPEGDLIENTEELPSGLVSWHGTKGTVPQAGDTFQVFDNADNMLFEEAIFGNMRLYDRNYATAEKKAPFIWEAEDQMKQKVCAVLENTFKRSCDPQHSLWNASSHEPACTEHISTTLRGIPFRVSVQEFISEKDCEVLEYKDEQFNYRPFAAGSHWFMVVYSTENDPNHTRSIGWGEGTAKEAALKISKAICKNQTKSSLDTQILRASHRTSDVQASISSISIQKDTTLER